MADPLLTAARSVRATPQSEPMPNRIQISNSAGGYGFAIDDWARLHRFLMLGTEGGTYYVGESELTRINAAVVFRLLTMDGLRVVAELVAVSESGAAPKQSPTLFALAAAASVGDDATRAAALSAVVKVCRTGTMLFQWNAYVEGMRGWGRARSRAVADWYQRPADRVAYQVVKYRQRAGWSHRDLLRLAHPRSESVPHMVLYDFICGRPVTRGVVPIVDAFMDVQEPDVTPVKAAELIRTTGLPWEALPDRLVNSPSVWNALLDNIGATALLRNLPRLTRLGLIKPMQPLDPRITKLTDVAVLRRARVHPVAILNALFGYRAGESRGGVTWTPVPTVVDLLDDAFHASFGAIVPANKRTLVALDVSGSMGWESLTMLPALTARDAAAAMAMATVRTEPAVQVVAFSMSTRTTTSGIAPLAITGRQRLDDVVRTIANMPFGGTDCALPMLWATHNKVEVDTFLTFTDNETWGGDIHPTQALERYRQASGIPARMVVSAMTSTGFSIADPDDAGQLDVVGFDAAAPNLIAGFSRGDL